MVSVELVSRLSMCPQGDAGRHGVVGEKGPNGLPVSVLHQGPTFLVKKFNMISFKASLLFHIMGISVVGPSRKGWNKGVQRRSCEFLFCFILTLQLKLLHCRSSLKFLSGLLHQGDPGKPGEPGPSGEPGIPVCI